MDRRAFLSRAIALPAISLPWAGLASLAGCAETGALTVGMHPWIGYETLHLAQAFGWLPENLSLVEGENATATQAGLKAGSFDAGCLTLDEVLLLRSEGLPMVVIAVMDISAGADVVLAKPEIRRLADLAGKRIAYEEHAVDSLMVAELLQAARLEQADVTLVPLPSDQQLAAWQAGHIDAAVTNAPRCVAFEKLGAIRLFDSRRIPDAIIDVLAVRHDRMAGRSATLKALLAAHFRAIDHLRHSREDAARRIAFWRQQSFEEVIRGLSGIQLPDAASNRSMLAPDGRLLLAAQDLERLMLDQGLLKHGADQRNLVDFRFLPELRT